MNQANEAGANPHGSQFLVKWIGPPVEKRITINNSADIQAIWREFVASRECFDGTKEHVVMIGLDARFRFIGWHLVSIGSANLALVPEREILRAALAIDAHEIVLVHNHPSGVVSPSKLDETCTLAVAAACQAVGMKLVDHVIVNSEGTDSCSVLGAYPASSKDAPATLPKGAAAENEIQSAGGGVKVMVPLPRPFIWKHGKNDVQAAVFSAVQNVKPGEWVKRWNDGPSLKKHLRRAKTFKIVRPVEIILVADDFQSISVAAAAIPMKPEELLAAIIGEVESTLARRKNAGSREKFQTSDSKILAFPGGSRN